MACSKPCRGLLLLLFVLPSTSVLAEKLVFESTAAWMPLVGRWSVVSAVGVRLFLAGMMQVKQR